MKLSYLLLGLALLLGAQLTTFAQNSFPVSGRVTNSSGEPLPGVTIQVKGVLQKTNLCKREYAVV